MVVPRRKPSLPFFPPVHYCGAMVAGTYLKLAVVAFPPCNQFFHIARNDSVYAIPFMVSVGISEAASPAGHVFWPQVVRNQEEIFF